MPWVQKLALSRLVVSPWMQQIRTTFILKRRYEVALSKVDGYPRKLRKKNKIYDFVEFTECARPQGNINVILKDYAEGIGLKGEEVSVKKNVARSQLLLPGLAVYATDENRKKYKLDAEQMKESQLLQHSSKTAQQTVRFLSKCVALVTMNAEHPWMIEPWHVKIAFRKGGIMVPEHTITLPSKPITGPNLELEGKCFLVTVTINGLEKVLVRCRIHHWHFNATKRPPPLQGYWEAQLEPVFPEDADMLHSLPSPPGPKQSTIEC